MSAVGVLALQGGFEAHARLLRILGHDAVEVRGPADLDRVSALVLPGGESTTQIRLLGDRFWSLLRALPTRGVPVLGTCAGAILLAREVSPGQPSLGLLDISIARNGYGRQVDSFEGMVTLEPGVPAPDPVVPGVFIRAPRITRLGPRVEVLARLDVEPVAVQEGNVIAATFHPELSGTDALHRLLFARPHPAAARPA